MSTTFSYEFDSETFKGKVSFPTGVFIDGKFAAGSGGGTIDLVDPTNGKKLTAVSEGTATDVDTAVKAARKAYEKSWGHKAPGVKRGQYLNRLADLMEQHLEELAAVEALNAGKTFKGAKSMDLRLSVDTMRYYAGWADKIHGQNIETQRNELAYTRLEPFGVVGQIIPWNFPLLIMSWKLGPALATGNCIVLKPSEHTPLTAHRMCSLINEAGFPPGVVNVVTGYGETVGKAIAEHMDIAKVAFTGSTLVGRMVMEAAAKSNLKNVTLELGGRSPNIVFDDADLELAADSFVRGIFWNHGQTCCAGSRIFVHEKVYDDFLKCFTEKTKSLGVGGDPFARESFQSPEVTKAQFERTMDCIRRAKDQGATVHCGGRRHGTEGYWIQPTIITNTKDDMDIVREEIFGPVAIVIKYSKLNEHVIEPENHSQHGLTASLFTRDMTRGIEVANELQAGTVWVNYMNTLHPNVPFGGFKQSGIGRECGESALYTYVNVKSIQINIGNRVERAA